MRLGNAPFDDFLLEYGGPKFEPFTMQDYADHVDGRPRADGVREFLASRGDRTAGRRLRRSSRCQDRQRGRQPKETNCDLHHNVRNGLHMASLASAWVATVAGFGGMRNRGGQLRFMPRVPPRVDRIAFRICFQQSQILVEMSEAEATYRLLAGQPLAVHHFDKLITVDKEAVSVPVPPAPSLPRPDQPAGRAPVQRNAERIRRNLGPTDWLRNADDE